MIRVATNSAAIIVTIGDSFQQPATNGPEPGAAHRFNSRRRLLSVNAAIASANLTAAGFFVIVPVI